MSQNLQETLVFKQRKDSFELYVSEPLNTSYFVTYIACSKITFHSNVAHIRFQCCCSGSYKIEEFGLLTFYKLHNLLSRCHIVEKMAKK